MSEKIEIRDTVESDKKYLMKWFDDPEVLKYFPLDTVPEVEDAVRIWLTYIKTHAAITLEIDGVPAGMATLYLQSSKKLSHQALFVIIVDKEKRGRGVGTKLLQELERRSKEQFGIEMLHLEVYEGNPAYALYKRLGYKEYGRHPHFLREKSGNFVTKIVMQKFL